MLLFLENQDSFSHLLADTLWRLGVECHITATHTALPADIWKKPWKGVIIGPGPGRPEELPHLMDALAAIPAGLPVLGVCLGMQALGIIHGATLGHAYAPCHGRVRPVLPAAGNTLYKGSVDIIDAVRYHSLALTQLPSSLLAEAHSPDGELMAMRHATLPQWGVQYHPEAILTVHGPALLSTWLLLAGIPHTPRGAPPLGGAPRMQSQSVLFVTPSPSPQGEGEGEGAGG